MNCTDFHEKAALAAIGLLDPVELGSLESHCLAHPDAADELRRLRDAAASFALLKTSPRSPSTELRNRLMDRIGGKVAQVQVPPERPAALPPGYAITAGADSAWLATPIPGVRTKPLASNPEAGYRVVLLELARNCQFPSHSHDRGPEELYVISGDLVTEGRTLRAGDHLHADAGTHHNPLWSPSGCVAMVIEAIPRKTVAAA